MNRVIRSLALILCAALAAAVTVFGLLLVEARTGHPLFSYIVAGYVPAGAFAAGLLAAAGLLGGAVLLRARPAPVVLIGLVAVAGGGVFVAQSARVSLASAGRVAASDPGSFLQYLANTTTHSQLQFVTPSSSHESSSSASTSLNPGVAHAAPAAMDGDASVQSLNSGVQGVVASQDMATTAVSGGAQRITQIGDGIQTVSSNVQNHGGDWLLFALQVVAFAVGGVLVYQLLRSRPYCEDCDMLLRSKGAQRRYFQRLEDINGSVEDVLANAKNRRLQLSIQAHGARGTAKKTRLAEFASVIRVSLCMRCQTHRMDFRALRKNGASWKEIAVLAYSASTFEPLQVTG